MIKEFTVHSGTQRKFNIPWRKAERNQGQSIVKSYKYNFNQRLRETSIDYLCER